jgi:hypothetical protein
MVLPVEFDMTAHQEEPIPTRSRRRCTWGQSDSRLPPDTGPGEFTEGFGLAQIPWNVDRLDKTGLVGDSWLCVELDDPAPCRAFQ